MNKILVTGGSGLVGSCFDNTIMVSSKQYDLLDFKQTLKMFDDTQPEYVIHCAAKVGGLGGNSNYKGDFYRENILINTNVIEAARVYGIKNLVAFLSTCIFPANVEYPLREEYLHNGPPHTSNDAYAYAKRMADVQIRAYKEQYGLNYKTVTPTNIYGPNDNFNLETGHVLPSLIHKMYLAKRDNTPMYIWGSGNPLREFIYSQDVADLTMWCLFNYNESETIILSNGFELSIKDVVNTLADVMEFKGDIIYQSDKPDGQLRKPTDISKIKKYLPNFQFTPIKDGLAKTVDWFYNNYPYIRS